MEYTTYTLQAGRSILKNGRPFAYIGNSGGNPTELDTFAREIVRLMNLFDSPLASTTTLLTAKDLENIFGPTEASGEQETTVPAPQTDENSISDNKNT